MTLIKTRNWRPHRTCTARDTDCVATVAGAPPSTGAASCSGGQAPDRGIAYGALLTRTARWCWLLQCFSWSAAPPQG